MLWNTLIELDALFSIIIIIIYGLISLRLKSLSLNSLYVFCCLFPLLFVTGMYIETLPADFTLNSYSDIFSTLPVADYMLALLLCVIMGGFQSFESVLLLMFAFVGQYYMVHSMDLLTFFISLEAQNFCFLVLCGLPGVTYVASNNHFKDSSRSFGVEAALKYFLLSAFSSGVILFWFSSIYTFTGMSVFSFSNVLSLYARPEVGLVSDLCEGYLRYPLGDRIIDNDGSLSSVSLFDGGSLFMILTAMMFKIGAAPLHLWVVQIYSAVRRNLIMYIATAPKLALFLFWVNSFQTVWSDYTLLLFSVFSLFIGAFGAYSQPGLRSLLAYSTVNEIGLLLAALDTAGFHTLFQHLGIYIVSQVLLWNLNDKRPFTFVAVSLAGLPPLAGFFGKAWIFWHVSTVSYYSLLGFMLFCTVVSLVYYLRVIRLFYNQSKGFQTRKLYYSLKGNSMNSLMSLSVSRVHLVSFLLLLLFVLPFFLIKPMFVA